MELGAERLDLVHQLVGELLPGDHRQAGDVVDGLLRIELRALTAGPIEDVDDMRLNVDETELKNGKKADRPCAHDNGIGADHIFGHGPLKSASRGCAPRDRRAHR